ncbi:MAG TPA: hypothetical protein VGA27_13425 [Candidatus Binatia bacterium]
MIFAEPWWVNLFLLVPFLIFFSWRQNGLVISLGTLGSLAIFASAFGFVEAAVVVYLRAAIGQLPGYGGTLADVARLSSQIYQQAQLHSDMPESLLGVEAWREFATIVMLASVALLSASRLPERSATFLWSFAIWDLAYYFGLWLTVGWPPSLLSPDVLFLIPVPWFAQVWLPILVSAMTLAAIALVRKSHRS